MTRKTKESLWGLSLDTTTPRSLEYERFYNKQRKEVRRTAGQVEMIYRNFKRSQGRKLEGLESSVAELCKRCLEGSGREEQCPRQGG